MRKLYRNPQTHVNLAVDARWFAGKGRTVAGTVEVGGAGGVCLVAVEYADGGTERYLVPDDGLAWGPLLVRLQHGPLEGHGGALELHPAAALGGLLMPGARQWVPATDQSNTLVTLGDSLLVKAYRRLEPGPHPEVELLAALAETTAPVPPFAGSLRWHAEDGTETTLALLQGFVADAQTGWESPILQAVEEIGAAGPPLAAAGWQAAGVTAARLEAALASAFPPRPATPAEVAGWERDALAGLDRVLALDASWVRDASQITAGLGPLGRCGTPAITRVHGDLHVAQLLRTPSRDLVIDFEGDPLRPLAERRRRDTPLRDLAALLRSVDHVGSAASRRLGGADPAAWIAVATQAVLDGYRAHAPEPPDPQLQAALELAKELSELIYAHRVLPEWRYAPEQGLRRLLGG